MHPAHDVSHTATPLCDDHGPVSVEIPITVDLSPPPEAPASYNVVDAASATAPLRRGAVVRSDGTFRAFIFMALLTITTAAMMFAAISYLHLDERPRSTTSVSSMTAVPSEPAPRLPTELSFAAASPTMLVSADAPAVAQGTGPSRVPSQRASSRPARAARGVARPAADADRRLAMAVAGNAQ